LNRSTNERVPWLKVDREALAAFCRRWCIAELAFFGSVLRDDFGPESDVDALVTPGPEAGWSLLDHVTMEDELSSILGRKAEFVTRSALERSTNWIRRDAILSTAIPYDFSG
jgi:hypothetical protein